MNVDVKLCDRVGDADVMVLGSVIRTCIRCLFPIWVDERQRLISPLGLVPTTHFTLLCTECVSPDIVRQGAR